MKRKLIQSRPATIACTSILALLMSCATARAQTVGYVTGFTGILPFDPTNATLLSYLHIIDVAGVAAVSADGSTLYVPLEKGNANLLGTFSASGDLITKIRGVGYSFYQAKVLLSPDGTTAFMMCNDGTGGPSLVGIVDIASQLVVGHIYANGGYLSDIAMSPDGKNLFVSVAPFPSGLVLGNSVRPQETGPVYDCTGANSVCAFNTSTFALENQVKGVNGYLSVSQDGASLYVVTLMEPFVLYAVNTSSFKPSPIALPTNISPAAMVVAPLGNQGVVVGKTLASGAFGEALIDTQTNTMTGTLQTPPLPAGTVVGIGSSVAAFSPDGKSLWTVFCTGESCTEMIAGQSFPSGNLIGEATLPTIQGFSGISF